MGTTGFFGSWSDIWLDRLFVLFGVVLSEWMADEFVVEIDSLQVRMPLEADTVQVEGLAFQPIGAGPKLDVRLAMTGSSSGTRHLTRKTMANA